MPKRYDLGVVFLAVKRDKGSADSGWVDGADAGRDGQLFLCFDPVSLPEPFWVVDDMEIAPRVPEPAILFVLGHAFHRI